MSGVGPVAMMGAGLEAKGAVAFCTVGYRYGFPSAAWQMCPNLNLGRRSLFVVMGYRGETAPTV